MQRVARRVVLREGAILQVRSSQFDVLVLIEEFADLRWDGCVCSQAS